MSEDLEDRMAAATRNGSRPHASVRPFRIVFLVAMTLLVSAASVGFILGFVGGIEQDAGLVLSLFMGMLSAAAFTMPFAPWLAWGSGLIVLGIALRQRWRR